MIKKSIKSILADNWYEGIIIKGRGRGKTLGFPTINLTPSVILIPSLVEGEGSPDKKWKFGVYSCQVKIDNKIYSGLLHYGPRPTFKEKDLSLEIHILSSSCHPEIVSGSLVYFKLLKFLRKIKKFKNKKELAEQIRKDILEARLFN